jgi:hypothetical protein
MSKKLNITLSAIAAALFISACGGGGSGGVAVPSANENNELASNTNIYFAQDPLGIQVPSPFSPDLSISTVNYVMDITGDGKKDLIVHLWSPAYTNGQTGSDPVPNKIYLFTQQPDGSFKDETTRYLIDGNDNLGGASRKVKSADLNGDGKPDLIFAMNQEDGRLIPWNNTSLGNSRLAGLISTGSKYKVVNFGIPNWYHAVGVGYTSTGKAFATGAGYSIQSDKSYFFDINAAPEEASISLPLLDAGSFELFSTNGVGAESNRLIQPALGGINYLSVEGHIKSNDGTWTAVPQLTIAPQVGTTKQIGYDGSDQGIAPVFQVNNKKIGFAGMSGTCNIKLNPSGTPITILKIGGEEISNFSEGMTLRQNTGGAVSFLQGVRFDGDAIVRVSLNITGEITSNLNANFFDCKDVNGDGYEDIVVYPYNEDGKPHVYINNKINGFSYIAHDKFPRITDQWGSAATSILEDFDGDGIPDLLIFPGNGINSVSSVTWRLYKGLKKLQ